MKSIDVLIKNAKNLSPYFLLIVIYFFFINIEARKELKKYKNNVYNDRSEMNKDRLKIEVDNVIIPIPVIPYK
tara:strand:- start:450 stop:668 length:219 start_codon:yes stop_codon:yes gene_type:complete